MEEKNISINEKKIAVIDTILNITSNVLIGIIAIFAILVALGKIGKLFYITADLIIIIILFTYPLMEFVKSYSQNNNHKLILLAAKLAASIIYGSTIMFILYKVLFSKSIVNERFYWLYNYIAGILAIIFVGIIVKGFVEDVIALTKTKASVTRHLSNFLHFSVVAFFIVIVPIIQYYQPKEVISFNDIKIPCELLVMDYRDKDSNDWNSLKKRSLNITDVKLKEDLQKEISKNQVENVRNSDRLNYEIRNLKGESYYLILPLYKELYGRSPILQSIKEGYIYEIRIHRNGEVVVLNYKLYTFPFKRIPEMYRLNLTEDYKSMIIQAIEASMEEKD